MKDEISMQPVVHDDGRIEYVAPSDLAQVRTEIANERMFKAACGLAETLASLTPVGFGFVCLAGVLIYHEQQRSRRRRPEKARSR